MWAAPSRRPDGARWDDNVYAFGLLADWDIKAGDAFTVSPSPESPTCTEPRAPLKKPLTAAAAPSGMGACQSWSIPVGITLKSVCGLGNGQALLPELSVAYVGDIARGTRTPAPGQPGNP